MMTGGRAGRALLILLHLASGAGAGLGCASKPAVHPASPASAPGASAGVPPSTPGVKTGETPPAPGPTPNAASAPGVPARPPAAILADAVAATGGAAAWNAHKTVRYQIDLIFQGMAMRGSCERIMTRDGRSVTITQMPALGTAREGNDGKVYWSVDPIQGLRFLEGAEREQARIDAAWNAEMIAGDLFAKLESSNERGPGGVSYECVIATPKTGAPSKSCYDVSTHLQVSQSGTRATPQGDIPYRVVNQDWRQVGGVKMPFAHETQLGPVTLLDQIKSVVFDQPVDPKLFQPPAQ